MALALKYSLIPVGYDTNPSLFEYGAYSASVLSGYIDPGKAESTLY